MVSDNPSGGDNQQETNSSPETAELEPYWVCGFVDGEGCFSVSFHRNPYVRQTRGWQVYPTFQVSQHRDNRLVLEQLAKFFGTGQVRGKGPNSNVLVYCVFGVGRLYASVVPFFERYPLRVKERDFALFAAIVRGLRAKEHLCPEGFERLSHVWHTP